MSSCMRCQTDGRESHHINIFLIFLASRELHGARPQRWVSCIAQKWANQPFPAYNQIADSMSGDEIGQLKGETTQDITSGTLWHL
jgi:hypothetical protein